MTGAITIIMGRATKDPTMQQGKNSNTEYISLDLAVNQKNQEGKEDTTYYSCFFNSFLAQRLIKAGVRKGTGLLIYGDLEIHPYIYQQGPKTGQAGVNAKIIVKDWQFTLSNKQEGNAPTGTGAMSNGNAMPNMGNSMPHMGNPVPNMENSNSTYGNQGFPNGNTMNTQGTNMNYQTASMPQNQFQGGAYPPPMMNGNAAPNYGMQQSSYPNDGFSNIPESAAGKLPFN